MIEMDQYELIRTAYFRYKKSIRQIAKEYGHHRKTIRKAINGLEPRYRRKKTVSSSVMGPVAAIVDQWLLDDKQRPKKQRHTAQRVYDRLTDEYEFKGATSTVRRWVRKRKADFGIDQKEAMIPLCPVMGKEAEIDWGTAKAIIGGEEKTVKIFCMRSRYSGKIFVRAYPYERQEMFFDAHMQAFSYFNGIYPVLVYDNLTTAIKRVLRGRDRIEQDKFAFFRAYYTFEARFCNPGQGHEKGGVEGLVGFARRNFMVPLPKADSFEELNDYFLDKCDRHGHRAHRKDGQTKTIQAYYEAEKEKLISAPLVPYENLKEIPAKVNPYQVVQVDRNWYSVPTAYTGWKVTVHVKCWQVTIYQANKKIAIHNRAFGRGNWCLNPLHYLDLLGIKPGGFDEARPIVQWRKFWPVVYEQMLGKLRERKGRSKGTREFIDILKLHKDHPLSKVKVAVQRSADNGAWNYESVKQLIQVAALNSDEAHKSRFLDQSQIPAIGNFNIDPPDLSRYNQLIGQEAAL